MVEATGTAKATGADLHAFIRHRFGMGDRLYGEVDAGRDKGLAFAAPRQYGQTIQWLFEAGSGSHMLDVAPYLVPIAYRTRYPYDGSGYLDLWAQKLGTSAGILLITPAEPEPLREHLRDLFRVTDEEDRRYFFRFYDPRVLRVYLPTCTTAEGKELFGPIRRILCEAEPSDRMLTCKLDRDGVNMDERLLTPHGDGPYARRLGR